MFAKLKWMSVRKRILREVVMMVVWEREVKALSYYLQRKVYKDEDNYELSDFQTKP